MKTVQQFASVVLIINMLSYICMYLSQGAYCQQQFKKDSVVVLKSNVNKKISVTFYGKDENSIAEAKLISNGHIVSTLKFHPIGTPIEGYEISGKDLGDKGFSGKPNIVSFMFAYPACDYMSGEVLLIIQGNRLIYGTEVTSSSTEDAVGSYDYLFPKDKGGQSDRLIVKYTIAPMVEHGNVGSPDYKQATHAKEIYRWSGTKLTKMVETPWP